MIPRSQILGQGVCPDETEYTANIQRGKLASSYQTKKHVNVSRTSGESHCQLLMLILFYVPFLSVGSSDHVPMSRMFPVSG